jgi:zinc protease
MGDLRPVLLDACPFAAAPFKVERWRYANGLTLILVEDHAAPVFAYQTWFDVGSANEVTGKTGIAHLFEHLMFKRTKHHGEGEFDRLMESHGGSSNAATWVDWTYYTSGLPSRAGNLELVADLEADRMENLILDADQVEAEREVVLNERRYRVDNQPDGRMTERLYADSFGKHPYGWPTIGWEKDIRAITPEDCVAFYRTWYSPNNATVVVVGDVDGAHVREVIGSRYAGLESQSLPSEQFTPAPASGASRDEMKLTIEADKILLGWRASAIDHPDRPALEVLEALAFHGASGRVKRRLVDEIAIAIDVAAMITPFKYPGLFEVKIDLVDGHPAEEAERELAALLTRFATEEVPPAELAKAKNQSELGFFAGLRTATEKAEALALHHVTMGDYRKLFDAVPRVQAVTAADVKRVAAQVFRPENLSVIVGRPEEGAS